MIAASPNLSYLLTNNLVERVAGISQAVAVSADGLLLAWTDGLNHDAAERVAAVAAGLSSLLNGAALDLNAGPVQGNITELGAGFLILMAVGSGASLLALTTRDADLAFVTTELGRFAEQVGDQLTPAFAGALTVAGRR
ncbi:roadblock/LC7 domain-containing protein [Micromonospora sp. WMMD956]|uniref:roadblock/LC7 domain-containing protein n=1 Tax=Micromonospora sp. WMMD956 TaxID=3016108 RepID=UPI002416640C|nr:roadblock/LC7 domain-containing protein [Micromonospora sp. WMMD956]MDG4820225.1 roadblock/LC7 domain-containing protein [Micromonospora sp. WMMD956]